MSQKHIHIFLEILPREGEKWITISENLNLRINWNIGRFCWKFEAKFYYQHASAGSNYHIQITEKMIDFFTTVLPTLSLYHIHGWLSGPLFRALDSQLSGCEFNSWPLHCPVTTLGKLFTLICLCRSQWLSGSMAGSSVTGHGQLCLSRQPLQCTALGTGCEPFLQCLGWLSLPPFVGWQNKYQLLGWVISTNGNGGCE